jgi:hypothetical protein
MKASNTRCMRLVLICTMCVLSIPFALFNWSKQYAITIVALSEHMHVAITNESNTSSVSLQTDQWNASLQSELEVSDQGPDVVSTLRHQGNSSRTRHDMTVSVSKVIVCVDSVHRRRAVKLSEKYTLPHLATPRDDIEDIMCMVSTCTVWCNCACVDIYYIIYRESLTQSECISIISLPSAIMFRFKGTSRRRVLLNLNIIARGRDIIYIHE